MTIEATLTSKNGMITTLSNGRHIWNADVAEALGSADRAPDPHDLLDSSLAACTALTLELYARRRKMPVQSIRVLIDHVEGKNEKGESRYQLKRRILIEGDLSDEERARLLEIANKCPVHKILSGELDVETELV